MRRGWRQLWPLLGDRLRPAAGLVAASVAAGFAEAAVLALIAEIASALVVGAHRLHSTLGPLHLDVAIDVALACALAVAVARLLLGFLLAWLPAYIGSGVQAQLRRDVFDAYTVASWPVQAREGEGQLQELMTNQIGQAMQGVLIVVGAMSSASMFFSLIATAFVLNALVAMTIIVTSVALFWLTKPLSIWGRRAARELSQASINYASSISEVVRLSEESHVFGAADANRRRVGRLIDTNSRSFFSVQLTGGLSRNVYQSVAMILIVVALAGLYLVDASNVAALGASVLMLVRASSYAQQFQGGFQALNQVVPYIDRLENAKARYRASKPPSGNRTAPRIESIAFERVSFAYRAERPALADVTFTVKAGEAIGIVGPSGAGKSTLIQLMLRLREPTSGAYRINGLLASSFDRHEWEQRVAYVAQEPRIMRATVAENIRFFRELDDVAVKRAASLANIHEDIMRLPSGYETVIGQLADAVSGGQRQRICIARALAANPEVLILDEPTSALDMASELAIQASLAGVQGQLTLFVAAHRISTLTNCDRLLVLADGTVEAFAPAPELERSNVFYQTTATLARGIR